MFIKKHSNEFPIEKMARVIGVSRSGYYEFIKKKPGKRNGIEKELLERIKTIHVESRQTYGSPRIHRELIRQGFVCSRKRVAKLMKRKGIQPKMRKKWKTAPKMNIIVAPNFLDQQFIAEKPKEKLVSDITYVKTEEGWLYVAGVMDLFSRKIVGLSMGAEANADLVINALQQASIRLGSLKGTLHHSDRGCQYTSKKFGGYADGHGIILSMSAKGKCYDNAAMESFFHTLKTEHIHLCNFKSREEARVSIFEYIEVFYNRKRLHSTLGYKTPHEIEEGWDKQHDNKVA